MESIEERIDAFLGDHNFDVVERIGFGIHGQVFSVTEGAGFLVTVLKFFEDGAPFFRELNVYRRLGEEEVVELAGCKVPRLIDSDDEHLTIQMSLVTRPFCLDFAAAYLDGLPDYFPPLDAEWHEAKREQFGDEDWRKVLDVLAELEGLGIYQADPSPTNISV